MPRFYCPQIPNINQSFRLPENICQHIHVLRLRSESTITLFNGDNHEYSAIIHITDKRHIEATITDIQLANRESPLEITLIQAVSTGERMDYTVQKSVELGVHTIMPILSEYSNVRLSGERASKRLVRWQEIARSACEQCGRNQLVTILPIQSFSQVLTQTLPEDRFILTPHTTHRLKDTLTTTPKRLALLIGAEGGFSANEETIAKQHHFKPIRLGSRILRTETASIVALSAMQTWFGDF